MSSLLNSTLNTRALPTGDLRYIRSDFPGSLSDEEVQWLVDNNITNIIVVDNRVFYININDENRVSCYDLRTSDKGTAER